MINSRLVLLLLLVGSSSIHSEPLFADDLSGVWEALGEQSFLVEFQPTDKQGHYTANAFSLASKSPWSTATAQAVRGGVLLQTGSEQIPCQYSRGDTNVLEVVRQGRILAVLERKLHSHLVDGRRYYLLPAENGQPAYYLPSITGQHRALSLVPYRYQNAFGDPADTSRIMLDLPPDPENVRSSLQSMSGGPVKPVAIQEARVVVAKPQGGIHSERTVHLLRYPHSLQGGLKQHASEPLILPNRSGFSRPISKFDSQDLLSLAQKQPDSTRKLPCVTEFVFVDPAAPGAKPKIARVPGKLDCSRPVGVAILAPSVQFDRTLLNGRIYRILPTLEFTTDSIRDTSQQTILQLMRHLERDIATVGATRGFKMPKMLIKREASGRPILRLEYPPIFAPPSSMPRLATNQAPGSALNRFFPPLGQDYPKVGARLDGIRAKWEFRYQIVRPSWNAQPQRIPTPAVRGPNSPQRSIIARPTRRLNFTVEIETRASFARLVGIQQLARPSRYFAAVQVDPQLLTWAESSKESRLKSVTLSLSQAPRDHINHRSKEIVLQPTRNRAGEVIPPAGIRWFVHRPDTGIGVATSNSVSDGIVNPTRIEADLKFNLVDGKVIDWRLNTRAKGTSARVYQNGGVAEITGGTLEILLEDHDWYSRPTF